LPRRLGDGGGIRVLDESTAPGIAHQPEAPRAIGAGAGGPPRRACRKLPITSPEWLTCAAPSCP
jgi:hypothetical protein